MKQWGVRLALGFVFLIGALGCHLTDTFLAQATLTPTRTRIVKPTFTPVPSATATQPPTAVPSPTKLPPTATRRPATKPPPTKPPVVVPTSPPPPPPVSQMQYGTANLKCEHAGNQYIKGRVYDSSNSDANGVAGLTMALGGAGGTDPWVTTRNEDDGFYTFTLSGVGEGPKPAGTYHVWIIDGSGKRISDVGGPININPLGPDVSGTCWAGSVDFYRR